MHTVVRGVRFSEYTVGCPATDSTAARPGDGRGHSALSGPGSTSSLSRERVCDGRGNVPPGRACCHVSGRCFQRAESLQTGDAVMLSLWSAAWQAGRTQPEPKGTGGVRPLPDVPARATRSARRGHRPSLPGGQGLLHGAQFSLFIQGTSQAKQGDLVTSCHLVSLSQAPRGCCTTGVPLL